jgi:hypothetical protein
MSIQINQYLMRGYLLSIEEYDSHMESFFGKDWEWREDLEKYSSDSAFNSGINHHNGLFVLYDGMSGEYVIVGKVVKKAAYDDGEGGYLPSSGPMRVVNIKKEEREEISSLINQHLKFNTEPKDIKTYIITHYR